jgi:ABC-type phosphate/phosphonate transport system ATPase subunit
VLVTHDVEGGLAEADLALGLKDGRQVFALPAAEIEAGEARRLYG